MYRLYLQSLLRLKSWIKPGKKYCFPDKQLPRCRSFIATTVVADEEATIVYTSLTSNHCRYLSLQFLQQQVPPAAAASTEGTHSRSSDFNDKGSICFVLFPENLQVSYHEVPTAGDLTEGTIITFHSAPQV